MKFLYLANIRMPTEKAHGAQIMKTCEALARAGSLEALVVSNRKSSITSDPFEYYGMQPLFPLERADVLDTIELGKVGFIIETISFACSAIRIAKSHPNTVIFGRDEIVLSFISFFSRQALVWESHTGSWNYAARHIARRARAIVVISHGLKEWYVQRGIPAEKIIVAPDAIDIDSFMQVKEYVQARQDLKLPDAFIALYAGRLDGWKGTDTLCDASKFLPPDVRVVIVGGEPLQIQALRPHYPDVIFIGSRPYVELPDILSAADALILPTSAKDIIGARFTSPMKLFAYMAAKKPIIATDLPSHREVLGESQAVFVPADDAQALAEAIESLSKASVQERETFASAAFTNVHRYTWEARARILEGIL